MAKPKQGLRSVKAWSAYLRKSSSRQPTAFHAVQARTKIIAATALRLSGVGKTVSKPDCKKLLLLLRQYLSLAGFGAPKGALGKKKEIVELCGMENWKKLSRHLRQLATISWEADA